MSKPKILPFSSEDFNWCVDNDFQVYGAPDGEGSLRIEVRRGGITTGGLDEVIINGKKKKSKVMVGKETYKTMSELSRYLPGVYKQLIQKYG